MRKILQVELVIHKKPRLRARIERERLKRAAEAAFRAEGVTGAVELGLLITDDREMRALHAQYVGERKTTDVLSFPGPGELAAARRRATNYLGDIAISYPQAKRQAREAGQGIGKELDLLLVHGILHLLGYDDHEPGARAKMWARQEEILRRLQ